MKINIVGDGSAGQRHAQILQNLGQAVSIYGPQVDDPERHGICQAVVIASPPETHDRYLRHYLDRGVHILCEGPVTIYDPKYENEQCALMTASNWRFVPKVQKVLDTIEQIGNPIMGHFWFDYDLRLWRPGVDYTKTCYYTNGIDRINLHEIDLCRAFMGSVNHTVGFERSWEVSEQIDALVIINQHESGGLSSINSSWLGNRYTRGYSLIHTNGETTRHSFTTPRDDEVVNRSYVEVCLAFIKWCQVGYKPAYAASLIDGYNAFMLSQGFPR